MIGQVARDTFNGARRRFQDYQKFEAENRRAEDILLPLIKGKRLLKDGKLYEIERIHASYDGAIHGRGYRILGNGKRGTQIWDIGFICERYFDEANA